mgnify:CR=1 FL=1
MAAAADPLKSIEQLIAQASTLPEPEAHRPSPEPLLQLSNAIRGIESSAEGALPPSMASPVVAGGASDSLDAIVGREVLRLVSERPLSAPARAEAVRRLTVALQNPSAPNLRSVLAVLVSDRTDV